MNLSERLTTDRVAAPSQRAARDSLRSQIARLERELAGLVAAGFPHISAAGHRVAVGEREDSPRARPAPRLPGIEDLERERDALVGRLRDTEVAVAQRELHERRARALLQEMELEPARHKFMRLRVADLGGRGCGVYEVRPRLGLIGMLAGWWRLTLSSGCPLGRGRALSARPASLSSPRDRSRSFGSASRAASRACSRASAAGGR